jgi:hypothetical protein
VAPVPACLYAHLFAGAAACLCLPLIYLFSALCCALPGKLCALPFHIPCTAVALLLSQLPVRLDGDKTLGVMTSPCLYRRLRSISWATPSRRWRISAAASAIATGKTLPRRFAMPAAGGFAVRFGLDGVNSLGGKDVFGRNPGMVPLNTRFLSGDML